MTKRKQESIRKKLVNEIFSNPNDKFIEDTVRRYKKRINQSNIEKFHQALIQELEIESLKDSAYYDINILIEYVNSITKNNITIENDFVETKTGSCDFNIE